MISKEEQLKHIKKNKTEKQKLKEECSKLWRKIVLLQANEQCEFPGCRRKTRLNSHHFFTKGGYEHLRYDPENGICLCYLHHKGGKEGAHCDPFWTDKIMGRIEGYKPIRSEKWLQKLTRKAGTSYKMDLKMELIYLQQEYEKLRKQIK